MTISMKSLVLLLLVGLGACTPFWRQWGKGDANAIVGPAKPVQESWCYKTLGRIDCYPVPQRMPAESLVSVDPPSRFPASREAYAKALADSQTVKKEE